MSGEYFCIEEVLDPSKFYVDYESTINRGATSSGYQNNQDIDNLSTSSKKTQDSRLYEIEEQLEIAENRCNTLKGQLDFMKKIYQTSNVTEKTVEVSNVKKRAPASKRSNEQFGNSPSKRRPEPPTREEKDQSSTENVKNVSSVSVTAPYPPPSLGKDTHVVPPVRQSSYAIGTDTTGAAVRTINNILTGITDSVNRLSEMHTHIGDSRSSESSQKRYQRDATSSGDEAQPIIGVEVKKFAGGIMPAIATEYELPSFIKPTNKVRIVRDARQQPPSHYSVYKHPATADRPERHSEQYKQTQFLYKAPHSQQMARNESYTSQNRNVLQSRKRSKHRPTLSKSKIQSSSGSVDFKKEIKVTARHVLNTTKFTAVRTAMADEESNSVILHKRRKKPTKRLKLGPKMSMDKKDSGLIGKQFQQYATEKLVELYHNQAINKESDSDESPAKINKANAERQKAGGDEHIPPLKIDLIGYSKDENGKVLEANDQNALSTIDERGYYQDQSARCCSAYAKNYELPTIASKLKQAAKHYLQTFNFKSIPFCAAKSTSPSHNIGLNIQQVMNIIKTRQPINGISPTLAHNIGLAAEKLHSRPLSVLVSSLSTRMGYGRSVCPLSRNCLNYQQLQEMAKEIPEETLENGALSVIADVSEVSPSQDQNQNVYPAGPFGDNQSASQAPIIWSVEPNEQQNCNCIPPNGVAFQQVLSKYNVAINTSKTASQTHHNTARPPVASRYRQTKVSAAPRPQPPPLVPRKKETKTQQVSSLANAATDTNSITPLQGKEKSLKEVLTNLHDEFETLNLKYEEMHKHVNAGEEEPNPETLRELEKMEKDLNNKEEEITMVMELYKEVLALKDQVKKLKDRASQATIALSQLPSRCRDGKDPKGAAQHLTKLLRQIQDYQMHYRKTI